MIFKWKSPHVLNSNGSPNIRTHRSCVCSLMFVQDVAPSFSPGWNLPPKWTTEWQLDLAFLLRHSWPILPVENQWLSEEVESGNAKWFWIAFIHIKIITAVRAFPKGMPELRWLSFVNHDPLIAICPSDQQYSVLHYSEQ